MEFLVCDKLTNFELKQKFPKIIEIIRGEYGTALKLYSKRKKTQFFCNNGVEQRLQLLLDWKYFLNYTSFLIYSRQKIKRTKCYLCFFQDYILHKENCREKN
jgi:hypothetical protein